MSNLVRPVQKSLWIDIGWLMEKVDDADAYVDIRELAREQGHYYAWLQSTYGRKEAEQHATAALLTVTGIRVHDQTNRNVRCQLDSDKVPHVRVYVAGITHQDVIGRVYAHDTTVRTGLEVVGLAGAIG